MKKILLILSAVAISGGAYLYAQDEEKDEPRRPQRDGAQRGAQRGGQRGGGQRGGFLRNSPLLKALKANEESGEISIADIAKDEKLKDIKLVDFLKMLDKAPEGKDKGDGKIDRTELFGSFGGGRGRGGARGSDRPRRPDGEAGGDRPDRPRSDRDRPDSE
jgi:hypothetical protein